MLALDKNLLELINLKCLNEVFLAYVKYGEMLLSTKEAQEFLGIKSRYTFLKLIEKGDIPARKIGGRIKISLVDLNQYLEKEDIFY